MTGQGTVVVIAKEPVAGRVKTRLCPPFSASEAAALAAAALADTLDVVSATRCDRRVVAFDGDPGPWVPNGFDRVTQPTGGLDVRLAGAFAATRGPAVLVGMDTPQLTPALLEQALASLREHDAVLGPAPDGGYWLIGLRRRNARAFLGVPMSTHETCARQQERLTALGLRTRVLAELRDVDGHEDAAAVAAEIPESRFASTHRAFTGLQSIGAST